MVNINVVLIVLYTAGWYATSIATDILNKKIQGVIFMPVTITVLQTGAAAILTSILIYVFRVTKVSSVGREEAKQIFPIALCWTFGFIATNFSFGLSNVSFTQSIKAAEPFFLVALQSFLFNTRHPTLVLCSLVPIVVGMAMVAKGEMAFSAPSFFAVLLSNTLFSYRTILAKDVLKKLDNLQLFHCVSVMSCLIAMPIALCYEGFMLWPKLNVVLETKDMKAMLLGNALFHYSYCQFSFMILARLAPLSHSVLNAARRFVQIVGTVWWLNDPVTVWNVYGVVLLLTGTVAYTLALKQSEQNTVDTTKKE